MNVVVMARRRTSLESEFGVVESKARAKMRFDENAVHSRRCRQPYHESTRAQLIELRFLKQGLQPCHIPAKPALPAFAGLCVTIARPYEAPVADR